MTVIEQHYETSLKNKDLNNWKTTMFMNGKHQYCKGVNSLPKNYIKNNYNPNHKNLVWASGKYMYVT